MRPAAWLALLVLLAPTVAARAVSYELEATDEGFRLAGGDEANPTLTAEAGDEVTLVLTNLAASPHNVHVGEPVARSMPCCLPSGEAATLVFTMPADANGSIEYWSDADPDGHRGRILVGPPLPRVRFIEPEEGADVGGSIVARVRVENFVPEPFPAGTTNVNGRGHVRFMIDGRNESTLTDQTTFTYANVPVGHHLLRVELVGRDGRSLDPPATHEVLVYRRADPTPPPSTPGEPTPPSVTDDSPAPGLVLVLAGAALAALSASRSRHRRR